MILGWRMGDGVNDSPEAITFIPKVMWLTFGTVDPCLRIAMQSP